MVVQNNLSAMSTPSVWGRELSAEREYAFLSDNPAAASRMYSEDEFNSYLEYRAAHDVWVGIDCVSNLCFKPSEKRRGGLLICFDYNLSKQEEELFLPTAMPSVCERVRLYGATLTQQTDNARARAAAPSWVAEVLSGAASLQKKGAKMLFRDGFIKTVASEQYQILPEGELVAALLDAYRGDFPDIAFKEGAVTHEVTTATYALNSAEANGMLAIKVKQNPEAQVETCVKFATSSVRSSAAYAQVVVALGGVPVPLGSPVRVEHKVGGSVQSFKDALADTGTLLRESEDKIEELGLVEIKNPHDCLLAIAEAKAPFLPKGAVEAKATELSVYADCTALDLYVGLCEVADESRSSDIVRYLNDIEKVASLINIDFASYDS